MNLKFDFTGKTAVVTGGASGIGKATVRLFVEAGANVLLLDSHVERGRLATKEFGRQVRFLKTEVTSHKSVMRAAAAQSRMGAIDILVNNAGIEHNNRGNLLQMPWKDLVQILDVNLLGYMRVLRCFMPLMKDGGRVIQLSSIQGLGAHSPGTSYQASKAGILGLTRALAIEVAERAITANSVLPGAIATEVMGAVRAGDSRVLDPYRRRIPAGRRGHAREVASVILFLASDAASYITGTELVVDGGYTANITPDIPEQRTRTVLNDPDL